MATQDAARLALIVCVLLAAFFGRLAWAWTFQAPSTARFSVRPVQCVATASVVVVILLTVRLFLLRDSPDCRSFVGEQCAPAVCSI